MNLPNKLTVARLCMAPLFFVSFFLPDWFGEKYTVLSAWLMLALYLLIEITDLADGIIARRWNLVTDLGKVLDPFADVVSRMTYFVCLSYVNIMPLWVFLVILYRELGMTFMRMVMMGKGKAVAANMWGKLKAVLYAVAAILGIGYAVLLKLLPGWQFKEISETVLLIVFISAAVAAVGSFITYIAAVRNMNHA